MVIHSFADRDTERLWAREPVRRFPAELRRVMLRKLVQVDAATRLDDLRVPPGNRLEKPLQLSQYRLAHSLSVPPRRINEIVHGKRAITADTALRLARFFGTSEQFWLNLQARHDLEVERDRLGARLKAEVEIFAAAI